MGFDAAEHHCEERSLIILTFFTERESDATLGQYKNNTDNEPFKNIILAAS